MPQQTKVRQHLERTPKQIINMSPEKKTSQRKCWVNHRNSLSLEEYVEHQRSYWKWRCTFVKVTAIPIISLVPLVLEIFVSPSNKVIEYWPFIAALVKSMFLLKLMWIMYCSRNRYGKYSGNFDKRVHHELLTLGFNKPLPLGHYVCGAFWFITCLLQTIALVYFLSFDNMVHEFTVWKLLQAVAIQQSEPVLFVQFVRATFPEVLLYRLEHNFDQEFDKLDLWK